MSSQLKTYNNDLKREALNFYPPNFDQKLGETPNP